MTAAASIAAVAGAGLAINSTASADDVDTVHIGEVQGVIDDGDTDFSSPLEGQTVRVQGVVAQTTLDPTGARGFFVQERADATDGEPNSSDGIYVHNAENDTLRTVDGSPAADEVGSEWDVAVGDEVVLEAEVDDYYGNVQFSGEATRVWDLVETGLDPLEAVEAVEVDPPDDAAASEVYFRRHLGMQMTVPADSVVTAGRDVFDSSGGEVWAMRGDAEAALQDDYAGRAFRDAHPLDTDPEVFDDGNGYLFVIGDLGVRASADDTDAVIAPAKTFDVITEAATGGVYLGYDKYAVEVAEDLALTDGPEPSDNRPVEPAGRGEASIASYNIENLYDTRDNPNSECDAHDDPGCVDAEDPEGNVDPPFDYVPEAYEVYEDRMGRMAEQIIADLHGPDVVMTQEGEAQDVCEVNPEWTPETALGEDRLVCDLANAGQDNRHADGRPDSLQELALVIAERGGPEYTAAGDLDSADTRGIMTGFLYQAEHVRLDEADAADPVLGAEPAIEYGGEPGPINTEVQNPKALNAALPDEVKETCTDAGVYACNGFDVFSRPTQAAKFVFDRPGGRDSEIYLVNNHFSSTPDARVLHRTEQANYLAAVTAAILDDDRKAKVFAAGDFNVFPRPDDPFAAGEVIDGDWTGPSDQLAGMYEHSGLTSLYDRALDEHPEAAYSYTYNGQAQTLDQVWASKWAEKAVVAVAGAHVNADYPADATSFGEEPAYGSYGVSDHDPEVVTIKLR